MRGVGSEDGCGGVAGEGGWCGRFEICVAGVDDGGEEDEVQRCEEAEAANHHH